MVRFGEGICFVASANAAICKATNKRRLRLGLKLSLLSLCGLIALAISGSVNPVRADQINTADKPYAKLVGFVQAIGAEQARAEQPKLIKVARADDSAAANYVGSKTCLKCHASQTEAFSHTLMGRIGKTPQGKGKFECENCHGPGSAHVKAGGGRGVGGIISFRPNDTSRTAEENNAICLACHQRGARTLWQGSTHETRGLQCTNCHTIMKAVSRKNQLKTAFQPDTCFQCHKDIRAKVMRSEHMPVVEGKMVCSDCHSPHGSYSDHLLKKATVNDVCFECHADKRGPFLWEHPPVVESCLNCHDPHGSINENMLKVSRPRLCQRCHNAATRHPANPRNPMQIQAINGGCVNCHSQFHGSNSPGGEFFLR
jgi:DmsE family decaheme c-type cytochrome